MNKVGFIILAAAVVLVSGLIFLGEDNFKNVFTGGPSCAQVLTPAFNPETGELRDFSTPCDVPEGWVQAEYAE